MAVKNNSELKAQVSANIRVNNNGEITPPKHKSILDNVIDSFVNIKDGAVLDALLSYSYSPLFNADGQLVTKKFVDDAIAGLVTGLTYQGTWDANTNTPAITSGVGTNGYYYIVNVAGTTSIDGISDWQIGDWILFNGTAWQKIDQSTNWADGYITYDLRYAKLDGSNQPFTGNISILNSGARLFNIESTDNTASIILKGTNGYIYTYNTAGTLISTYDNGSITRSGQLNFISSSSAILLQRTGLSSLRIATDIEANLSSEFLFRNSGGGTTYVAIQQGANINNLRVTYSMKLGNTTQTAASAGAGSLRYNSGLQVSDGATWASVGGGVTDFAKETYSMADITGGGSMAGTAVWTKIIMSADCTVNRIGTFVTSASAETIYMGIYDNAGNKLVDGNVASGSVVAGVNVATISDTSLQAGTAYWLCVKDNMSGAVNIGNKTTLADSNLCKALYVGAGSLPATQGLASANGTSYYCFVSKV